MSDIIRSQCRLPKELNEWLINRAKQESRSKNAQMVVELRARRDEVERGAVFNGAVNGALGG
ncbi:hypothetical protein GCT13_25025 [Paraburkholderia sp. CNPSo 3157]|uniref:Arc-like DNA binding domain-containing protein n=1 Tax=Paraburkholderia franconis TaxID=2654983 RepID=A0A7X1NDT7_9BURK|nr:hypothetical protein [Paraburkholderia franconis]MPW20065.1 hypothetical protein [Paraburkholderia franconis]